jgi:hypothetical protein
LWARDESVCALVQEGNEFGGLPERIGDRAWRARGAYRGPQLAGHLGDQQRPGRQWLGVQGREASQGSRVVGIRKTDRDTEALVEGGAGCGPTRGARFDEPM